MSKTRVQGSHGRSSAGSRSWLFSTSFGPCTDLASVTGIVLFIAVFIDLSSPAIQFPRTAAGRTSWPSQIVQMDSFFADCTLRPFDKVNAIERPLLQEIGIRSLLGIGKPR
jgi:hypothetical protein